MKSDMQGGLITIKALSEEELLKDLKRVSRELGKSPTQVEYNEHGKYSHGSLAQRFGGWNEAKKKAGLETITNKKYHDEEIRELLEGGYTLTEIADEFGTTLSYISQRVSKSGFKILNQFTRAHENNFIISLTKQDLLDAGYDPTEEDVYFDKRVDNGRIILELSRERIVDDDSNIAKYNKRDEDS